MFSRWETLYHISRISTLNTFQQMNYLTVLFCASVNIWMFCIDWKTSQTNWENQLRNVTHNRILTVRSLSDWSYLDIKFLFVIFAAYCITFSSICFNWKVFRLCTKSAESGVHSKFQVTCLRSMSTEQVESEFLHPI